MGRCWITNLQKCVRCCTCSVTEWPCDELCQIKTWEGHLASQDIPVSATLLRCAGLVLVVERGAVVAADVELLDPHAAVVLLHRGDHHVFEPQPREGGSNSSSVFDFRVLKRVQRQFPSAETAQNWTILEDPGTSSHPEPEVSKTSATGTLLETPDSRSARGAST